LWAIPDEIISQAPEAPWIHPPEMFKVPIDIADSISHQKARELLSDSDTILDIGCGGGIATFAVAPPAASVIGVDHQPEMLTMFKENADHRGLDSKIFEGFWPAIAAEVPIADVVVTHHVAYNVPNIEDFLIALNNHARKRVVIEVPQLHPLTAASPMWKHFWNLERPTRPTSEDLFRILGEIGIGAQVVNWEGAMGSEISAQQQAHFSRIRLCLPESREGELLDFLQAQPPQVRRGLATIWWDI
jgi:SAM-dependent methyltransferase